MRVSDKYLQELIANDGKLTSGSISNLGVLRIALDLHEARERVAELEAKLRPDPVAKPAQRKRLPVAVQDIVMGSKLDCRAMTIPKKELFIWWTTNAEAIKIGDKAPAALPEYVRKQYHNRRGFGGQGPKTLWVDDKFGPREIAEWPDTNIARMIRDGTSAGIVFAGSDMPLFKNVPGIVTDFRLRLIVI